MPARAAAVDFLLRDAHAQGKLTLPDPQRPAQGSGWILLGMGKLGARELNFSSDIDLIAFFDPRRRRSSIPLDATDLFSRLTRRLVRILQDRTEAGYVFRTDLRLRPDPGSTPLAIPVEAALNYYEGSGQNWERAAMIKARPVAGDIEAGEAFLAELKPYVWRKYMDYAAIADVHSIKRQIHAHKGFGEIAVKGHNVKLGRGGIREIEFFVQTQQLIAGGRFPELRGRETVAMLDQLADAALDHGRGARHADQAVLVPAPRRARRADGGRRADAHAARQRRGARPDRASARLRGRDAVFGGVPGEPAGGRAPLCRAVRDGAGPVVGHGQSRLHRRCRRSRHAAHAGGARLQARRATSPASSAPGISGATRRRSRPRRASG